MTDPARLERATGRVISLGDTWFQIERLYRFNAKFFPRWEPRWFMFESFRDLPRAALAALFVEGLVTKPSFEEAGAKIRYTMRR